MVEQHVNVNCEGIKNYNYEGSFNTWRNAYNTTPNGGTVLYIQSMITIIYIYRKKRHMLTVFKEHENGIDDTVGIRGKYQFP